MQDLGGSLPLMECRNRLSESDSSVVRRHKMMKEHLESMFLQYALSEINQQRILEHTARQPHGVDAGLLPPQEATADDHLCHAAVNPGGQGCNGGSLVL